MNKELVNLYDSSKNNLLKEKDMLYKEALIKLSNGEKKEQFKDVQNSASKLEVLNEKIKMLDMQIKDEYDRNKLKRVNNILRDLNVKFEITVHQRKYYIQLRNYKECNFDKDSPICSDGEDRILAFAYFLTELETNDELDTIVIDDPITSLDLSRKSEVSYKIKELFEKENIQTILLTHDISFIEKIQEFLSKNTDSNLLEMRPKLDVFYPLDIKQYLVKDSSIYKNFICNVDENSSELERLTALMSLRPLVTIACPELEEEKISDIMKRSTYFAHTIYSQGKVNKKKVVFNKDDYNCQSLREYVRLAKEYLNFNWLDDEIIVPDSYNFNGFNYNYIRDLYKSISINNVEDARKKALFLRIMLEASLYQIVDKKQFNFSNIGSEYTKAINGNTSDRKNMCIKLKQLYDQSKKFHHGTDGDSTLGLAYINPDELEYCDEQINNIIEWIDANCTIK